MKIKTVPMRYEDVLALSEEKRVIPKRPNLFFRTLVKVLSEINLKNVHFKCEKIGMDKLGKHEPCIILMNHSCFTDLMIASKIFYPRPLSIVCTSDGFVGKKWLMRNLGCIPTAKFVTDYALVRDMIRAVSDLKSSILMYPEASYSFDGTATPLPDSVAKCLKFLNVPVIFVRTYGAFQRDPLYNNLQLRNVDISATVEYLLSPEQLAEMPANEINALLKECFSFDNFQWQKDHQIQIREPFRADCLNRVLYKCPHCMAEGRMLGKGTTISCIKCGKTYELTEHGYLKALDGESKFTHIPDWYRWERECVRKELENNTYRLDIPVEIRVLKGTKAIYEVGSGNLVHDCSGFHLTGCDGALDYRHKPVNSYSLYSDFYWYEIGDMICIGKADMLYYCFPKVKGDIVAKARLAAEELYKLSRDARKKAITY